MGTAAKSPTEVMNRLLQRVARRSEMSSPERLQRTFVEVEQITSSLRSIDHGVIYGRRGTGKTHAFTHLSRDLEDDGDLTILIDLRRIGSNGGLYADVSEDFSLRASQLLIDVVEEIHTRLFGLAVEYDEFSGVLEGLDDLAMAATDVKVEGPLESTAESEEESSSDSESKLSVSAKLSGELSADLSSGTKAGKKSKRKISEKRSGAELPRIRFGQLSRALERICQSIAPARLWVLLDEWSSLPLDLQPVLADMLRRAFFTCPGLTVKIGAIERRSKFIQRQSSANYIGIELGADTAAALNLDEHLIHPDDAAGALEFYGQVISQHLSVTADEASVPWMANWDTLQRGIFEGNAMLWLVRAAEGVPRDAMNILGLAAGYARDVKIRAADIDRAAHVYYVQDKEKGIVGNRLAQEVWKMLQVEVVSGKRSRTFLLRRTQEEMADAMFDLYDARLIHLRESGLSTPSRPGVKYDGYAIDYGSYVRMLEEVERNDAWSRGSQPWKYDASQHRNDVFLPDRFDESVIFTPSRTRMSEAMRRRGN